MRLSVCCPCTIFQVQTQTTLQPQTFPLAIVSSDQGLDPQFKPFLEQPLDGIFYIYGYMMWTTMYLPKECSPDPTRSKGIDQPCTGPGLLYKSHPARLEARFKEKSESEGPKYPTNFCKSCSNGACSGPSMLTCP